MRVIHPGAGFTITYSSDFAMKHPQLAPLWLRW